MGKVSDPPGFDLIDKFNAFSGWKKGLIACAVLIAVIAAVMPEICFMDNIFLTPDSKAPISFTEVGKKAIREEGIYPLWNPYIFSGMPSYSSMMFTPRVYPPSWIIDILHKYFFLPQMGWLLIHYFVAGIGVYLLSRSLKISPAISLLCGVVFVMLPNYLAMGANGHGSQACAVAYIPYGLLFSRELLRGRRKLMMAGLLALTLGVQMLRGHVQISYYTYMIIGLLFIFESVSMLREGRRKELLVRTIFLLIAFLLAVGIAMVLIGPVRNYAQHSIRGGSSGGGLDYGYATGWSLHPREVLTFVFPWAFGFGKETYWGSMPFTDYPNYLGVITVIFSVIAIFRVRTRTIWFLVTAAVLATLLSFGKHFPFYNLMFHYFPYFNKFRVPVMVLIIQQIAIVLLMGAGLQNVLNSFADGELGRPPARKAIKIGVVCCAAFLLLSLAGSGMIHSRIESVLQGSAAVQDLAAGLFARDLIKTAGLFTLAALLLFAASLGKISKGNLLLALALLLFVDLLTVSRSIIYPEGTWKSEGYRIVREQEREREFKRPDEVIRFLKEDDSMFRIFPAPAVRLDRWSHNAYPFNQNKYMIHEIFSAGGYHAAKLQNYQNLMDRMFASFRSRNVPVNILNMLNIKYIVSEFPLFRENETFPLVWQKGQKTIYRNSDFLPRVFFVDRQRVMERERMLSMLVSPDFDPSEEVLLESRIATGNLSDRGSRAEILEYGLNSIKIRAHTEAPCIMVTSEIYYPEWKAEIDGESVDILRADYCLRAVSLSAGEHVVEFRYDSQVLKGSLVASIIAFSVSLIISAGGWFIHRRRIS